MDDTSLDSLQVKVIWIHKVHRADENHAMVETVEAVIVAIKDQCRDKLVELSEMDVFKNPRNSGEPGARVEQVDDEAEAEEGLKDHPDIALVLEKLVDLEVHSQ